MPPAEALLAEIRDAYEHYLLDDHPTAGSIFCQQVGQILGLETKAG